MTYEEPKKILVTGGAGSLGSQLFERLLSDGHEVICIDNFFSGSKKNVEHLVENTHFELIRHDVPFHLYIQVEEMSTLS